MGLYFKNLTKDTLDQQCIPILDQQVVPKLDLSKLVYIRFIQAKIAYISQTNPSKIGWNEATFIKFRLGKPYLAVYLIYFKQS